MKLQKIAILFLAIVFTHTTTLLQSQARLMINDNAYVRMNGGTVGTPVYIVVDNGNANAVSTIGTGGNLVSEGEFNKLRWNITTNTGSYVLPWTSNPSTTNTKFPLTVQITVAGAGAGLIDFSTYETATDMNIPWASYVTHMTDADNAPADNSLNVMDRYWIMDNGTYPTKPDVNITFGYVDNVSEYGGTNTIAEGNLVAQRWNNAIDEWEGDFTNTTIAYGTANTATNQVTGVDITVAEFHEVWVLVNNMSLLPVELFYFTGNCINNQSVLEWSTASETNSDYYQIEKSFNGLDYFIIGQVDAAVNSNTVLSYSFIDPTQNNLNSYYRIKQVDMDGNSVYFNPVSISSCTELNSGMDIYVANDNEINFNWIADAQNEYIIEIYSIEGKLIQNKTVVSQEGLNHFTVQIDPATAIYFVSVKNNLDHYSKKIFLK